ncbi:retrovirus-related pol polyprotein from transposon TNT 1-94 [Tanacetum coccineum]|uniref:Retrovirus-related pol polyprotein from transposon TNT 1-94 n=1 Tax=Tanacetum coccineum TaxID=301880 RepID=A0ABQ4YTB6_9ASTR
MTTLAEFMIVAGAENRPPMLDKTMYNSWESRMLLYIKGKKNDRMMLESIENEPLVYPTVKVDGQIQKKKYVELTEQEQLQDDCDVQATNIVLQGLPPDVYALPQISQPTPSVPQNAYHSPLISQQPPVEFLQIHSGLVVPVFLSGDDPIACLNETMTFMSTVVSSSFLSTNNQLKTSFNPQNQATIQDGRVTVQQVQGRQGQSFASLGTKGNATSQVLDEEQLAFLVDPDAYDSDYDDISSAKAVLMAKFSSYDSDNLSEKAQRIKPILYDGNVLLNKHDVISVVEEEEILILEEESRSKMLAKQNDLIMKIQKINTSPTDYNKLNKLAEDFGKHFVPQMQLSAEQAFRLPVSNPKSEQLYIIQTPVEIEVVKVRTTLDAITKGLWGFEHTKKVFKEEVIPFINSLRVSFKDFENGLHSKLNEVKTMFGQMEAVVDQCSVDKKYFDIQNKEVSLDNDRLLDHIICQDVMNIVMHADSVLANVSDTRPPMLDRTDFASWQQRIRLYCRVKENRVNILKSIDEGPFQMGTFRENLAEGDEGALHLGCQKDIYSLINHYTDAKDIWDNVKMLLEGSELTKKDRESQLVVVQSVQGRQNRGQGNNARGTGTAGYEGALNRVGNANPGQSRQVKCYNCNGIGHIARNCTQPKRPHNSEYFKDKMLLMQAQKNRVTLDEEQLLFLAGGQDNVVDEDMDEQPVQDLALNVDNVFQADNCDAFDSDVDEAPTAQTMFMANLSSANPDAVYEHHEEHEMHDDVQPNYIVDSHADYTSNCNMISYDQYVKDNAMPVVQSNESSVTNDAYMMIYNDMCEHHAQSVSKTTQNIVVDNSLSAELETYKEEVELYERRARFELTEREQKIDE